MIRNPQNLTHHQRWGFSAIAVVLLLCGSWILNGCAGLVSPAGNNPPTTTLAISGTSSGNVTQKSATVSWHTNLAATSQVRYGTTSSYGSATAVDSNMVTGHQQSLTGLKAGTLYHFSVTSQDDKNQTVSSSDSTFTTAAGPDTTPPTVSINSPVANATLSGLVNVTALASDNVGVASLQFKVDSANRGAGLTSAPYALALDTKLLSDGNHILTAVATDAAGNSATSAGVAVKVNNQVPDTTPPTVAMTAPVNGATVSGPVIVAATAQDNVSVASVQFQLDNANIGAAMMVAPYVFTWDTAKAGPGVHTLRAIAKDGAGNSATSGSLSVTVSNAVPDTTPPTVPSSLKATAISSSQINLSWSASTDNTGVTGYNIYRGGTKIKSSNTNSYSDTGLAASTTFTYTVAAFDADGNTSAQSGSASATTPAASSGGGIPSTLGWYQIPNTKLRAVCPPNTSAYAFTSNCQNIMAAWSGGIADTKRNRLLVWGGGHVDYYGNELYALDLNNLTMTRLNDPSPLNPGKTCVSALSDGKANARHTYGGLSYIAHDDKMYVFSGIVACSSGGGSNDTWTLDLSTLSWARKDPTNGAPPSLAIAQAYSDYDPNSKNIFVDAVTNFASYNPDTNTYKSLNGQQNWISAHASAVIDPDRKLFIIFGPNDGNPWGTLVYDISAGSNFQLQNWTAQTTGCSALQSANFPGLAYDPVQKVVVGWAGGDTVYLFNPDTKTCTPVTYPNGPGAQQTNGTHGRFRYFPNLGVFAVVNDVDQNAYTLRIDPASAQALSISGVSASGVLSAAATINWSTNAAANSQVLYGTTSGYGQSTALDSSMVSSHSQTISGLTASTTYHYQVKSQDGSGNTATSPDFLFTTSAVQTVQPPVVSSVNVTNLTSNTATISWSTDQNASTQVLYGTSSSYGSNSPLDNTMLTSHTVNLAGLTAGTVYHFEAQSVNVGNAMGTSGGLTFTTATVSSGPAPTTANTVTVQETSGNAQSNRPISISRAFVQGEIPNFAQAVVGSTPVLTQCDVKNRWPDGSLKFAIVSFIMPSISANSSATVSFVDQSTGNNSGFLLQPGMLDTAYDFDSTIHMLGSISQSVSARAMLTNGNLRYWLQGPIVTAVILEDRTQARSYDRDFGDGSKALHPIFEAWFYPANHKVEVGATIENTWVSNALSNSMRDLTYQPTITAGAASPTVVFTQGSLIHIGASRWHKRFWVGGAPGSLHIDHNLKYLVQTRAIPNYDTNLIIAPSLIQAKTSGFTGQESIDGSSSGIGRFDKNLAASGASDWIGLMSTWETVYLMTMNEGLRTETLTQADLAGRIPFHYREADSNAGTGHFFDKNGAVDTFGRTVSVNARHQLTLGQINWLNPCDGTLGADTINIGSVDAQNWVTSRDHIPSWGYVPYLMSGRYFYLEELQYEASFILMSKLGCYGGNFARQGEAGYINDSQLRGNAWSYRTLAYAAFISPDGSAEKTYYEDKLANNIIKEQGSHNILNTDSSRQTHWNWGFTNQRNSGGEAPLHFWTNGGSDFIEAPLKTDGSLLGGSSPWEEGFFISALGMARDFGYPGFDPVLAYLPNRSFHILLDPAVNNPYLFESYRYPAKLTATNNWVSDWNTYKNEFVSLPTGWKPGFPNETTDHSYGFISMTAVGFMYPYTADGYSGQQAWNFIKTNKPNQGDFATQSPKWDILPRTTN